MEWNKDNLEEIVNLINEKLGTGETMVSIEQNFFNVAERVIHKRLMRSGYKRNGNEYILKADKPADTLEAIAEPLEADIKPIKDKSIKTPTKAREQRKEANNNIAININSIEADKLNNLIQNHDKIIALLENKNEKENLNLRSNISKVVTMRFDEKLYEMAREIAKKKRVSITEICNSALEQYLKEV